MAAPGGRGLQAPWAKDYPVPGEGIWLCPKN